MEKIELEKLLNPINLNELILYVNLQLSKGLSLTKIELGMGLGKGNIRNKLNRKNFIFDKEQNKYLEKNDYEVHKVPVNLSILKSEKIINKQDDKIKMAKNKDVGDNTTISYKSKTKNIKDDYDAVLDCNKDFNEEDIEILKDFISRSKAINTVLDDKDKGSDKVHSIRCYNNIYTRFKKNCDMQNIRMQDALYVALSDYINKK